ncbi:histidine kinase [Lentilactobacillus fungorum]|uniref:histidine kinase n=1 Tax=Lentilactobacillus fungorum TaxID=2201250 RepID=A0ABQ3W2Y3_9LACO|nr:sensor histidine kinase [Lentilactobacillus fungorum]GHP13989.1 histidine kinase [Lentilactobacillus fungorum]
MNSKDWLKQLIKSQITVILLYIGMLLMVWGLCELYQVPQSVVVDLLRFTWIPLVVIIGYRLITQYLDIKNLQQSIEQDKLPIKPHNPRLQPYWQALVDIKQQQVRRQRSLDQRMAKKQDYLMLWSHEIKLPLTALQLLAENNDSVKSDDIQQQIHLITNQMTLLLNYERLADFHHDLDFTWQSVEALIMPIIKDDAIFFINKRLSPQLTLGKVQVLTDKKWLSFILEQVIFNALKYSTEAASIDISWQENQLAITDHGIGISASDLPRVFEPGFTGENGRRQQAATGMGLYMAHKVAKLLGEKLTICSTRNIGTTVTLTFQKDHVRFDGRKVK